MTTSKQELSVEQIKKLPPYMTLNGTALRLKKEYDSLVYYRDAGIWSVEFQVAEDGKVRTVSESHKQLHDVELVPCTYLEWKDDNAGYLGKGDKAYKFEKDE